MTNHGLLSIAAKPAQTEAKRWGMKSMKYRNAIFVIGVALLAGCLHHDPRLYGTWKSDAEISMQWNRAHVTLTDKMDSGLSQIFGRMTDTCRPDGTGVIAMEPYTLSSGTNTHAMPGFTNTYTYTVIRRTQDSVVVKTTGGFMAGHVGTVHFDGSDKYWLLLNEDEPEKSAREYFRRIEGPNHISGGIRQPADGSSKPSR